MPTINICLDHPRFGVMVLGCVMPGEMGSPDHHDTGMFQASAGYHEGTSGGDGASHTDDSHAGSDKTSPGSAPRLGGSVTQSMPSQLSQDQQQSESKELKAKKKDAFDKMKDTDRQLGGNTSDEELWRRVEFRFRSGRDQLEGYKPFKFDPKFQGLMHDPKNTVGIHKALGIAGMVPILGFFPNAANSSLYAFQGNENEAIISGAFAAMDIIPFGGIVSGAAKGVKLFGKGLVRKLFSKGVEETVEGAEKAVVPASKAGLEAHHNTAAPPAKGSPEAHPPEEQPPAQADRESSKGPSEEPSTVPENKQEVPQASQEPKSSKHNSGPETPFHKRPLKERLEDYQNRIDKQKGAIDDRHLTAARDELAGKLSIPHPTKGRPYIHSKDVANSQQGLYNAVQRISRRINYLKARPKLTDLELTELSELGKKLKEATDLYDKTQTYSPFIPKS